jgi:hypothetical protein
MLVGGVVLRVGVVGCGGRYSFRRHLWLALGADGSRGQFRFGLSSEIYSSRALATIHIARPWPIGAHGQWI